MFAPYEWFIIIGVGIGVTSFIIGLIVRLTLHK